MTVYVLHDPNGLASPLSIPSDYASNPNYAWVAFASGERAALNVAAMPRHRVCVDARYVPDRITDLYRNPASHVGYAS